MINYLCKLPGIWFFCLYVISKRCINVSACEKLSGQVCSEEGSLEFSAAKEKEREQESMMKYSVCLLLHGRLYIISSCKLPGNQARRFLYN